MNSFFSGRILIMMVGIIAAAGFTLGYLHWNPDHTACLDGKHWQSDRWLTTYAIGRLEFRTRDYNYDCNPGMKVNTDEYKLNTP